MTPFRQLNRYMEIAGGWEITRRYFVMNGFDGILTILGVALGMYIEKVASPSIVVSSGIGASVAIGISGFWIAFLTEEAEQAKEKRDLEEALLTNLDESVFSKAGRTAAIINSLVDGLSPFLFGIVVLFPFFFAQLGIIEITVAYYLSFIIAGILLFVLGMFLGMLSRQNLFIFGIKTFIAGIVVGLLILLLGYE